MMIHSSFYWLKTKQSGPGSNPSISTNELSNLSFHICEMEVKLAISYIDGEKYILTIAMLR